MTIRTLEISRTIQFQGTQIRNRNVEDTEASKAIRGRVCKAVGEEYLSCDISKLTPSSFVIELHYHETSFSDLQGISEEFKTKDINLGSEMRNGGYCETCSYYIVNLVTVKNYT